MNGAPDIHCALDDPEAVTATPSDTDEVFANLIRQLNRLSVDKHHDAYVDIDWDAPEMAIDPADPRWELGGDLPLSSTEWYRSLPNDVRARLGLHWIATKMKMGLVFESVLKRGLLNYASTLPNNTDEFRYVYHEVIEEAQHSLMFQEFVNRTGMNPRGLSFVDDLMSRIIVASARPFPELFFFFVLGGEDPIDHVQRSVLRSRGGEMPPIVERIMRIHVMEEARHLSYARMFLKKRIPRLGPVRRGILAVVTPITLAVMAEMMMKPSRDVVETYRIPADVIRESFTDNPEFRAETVAALAKVRNLCHQTGLITAWSKRLWIALGIWE